MGKERATPSGFVKEPGTQHNHSNIRFSQSFYGQGFPAPTDFPSQILILVALFISCQALVGICLQSEDF
jgi:hypothetical protein